MEQYSAGSYAEGFLINLLFHKYFNNSNYAFIRTEICFNVIKFSLVIICTVFLHAAQSECNSFVDVLQCLVTGRVHIFAEFSSIALGLFSISEPTGQQQVLFHEKRVCLKSCSGFLFPATTANDLVKRRSQIKCKLRYRGTVGAGWSGLWQKRASCRGCVLAGLLSLPALLDIYSLWEWVRSPGL